MRVLTKPIVALKWHTPNPEFEIETAGRVCWESWGRGDGTVESSREFIRRLKKVGHIDVMEEAELSVWIECSRTASHQIVRHRTQHHLQASQRYISMDKIEVMCPPKIADNGASYSIFLNGVEKNYADYEALRKLGIRKEDARFVLPNACLTKMKAKANLANWRKFIALRSDSFSQWEIQMISNSILMIAAQIAPSVFEDQFDEYIVRDDAGARDMFATIEDRSHFDYMFQDNTVEAE